MGYYGTITLMYFIAIFILSGVVFSQHVYRFISVKIKILQKYVQRSKIKKNLWNPVNDFKKGKRLRLLS